MSKMVDLEEVVSNVERIELSAPTRQRHLARLHALQGAPAGGRPSVRVPAVPAGLRRSRAVPAGALTAAAVAVVAAASALLVTAHHSPPAAVPVGAGSSTTSSSPISPTDRAAAPATTTGTDAPGLTDAQFSKQLADLLGINQQRASTVTAALRDLAQHGDVDPKSAQFAQVATAAGLAPEQLAAAIDRIKKADVAVSASTGPGQQKGGSKLGSTAGVLGALQPSTASGSALNLLTTEKSVAMFRSTLGLDHQESADLADKLAALGQGAGLDPGSTAFQAIAHNFGVTPAQLAGVIDQIKRAAK